MKAVLILLVLFSGKLSLAQSKQVLNARLNAELVVKRQAYDSMATLYDSLNTSWKYDYSKTHIKRMDQFRAFEKEMEYNVSRIQKINSILKENGQPEAQVKQPRYLDMVAIVVKYKSSVSYSPSHEFVSEINTSGATLKENNNHLKEYIRNLDKAYPINEITLDSIRFHMTQMDQLLLEVNSVLSDYELQAEYFRKEHEKLLAHAKERNVDGIMLESESVKTEIPACDIIYEIPEEQAEYPGGKEALMKYFDANIQVPKGKEAVSGKVYLRFVISETGKTSNVQIMKGMEDCPGCDAEAIRLVQNMPLWIPAKQNGANVCMKYVVSVPFYGK